MSGRLVVTAFFERTDYHTVDGLHSCRDVNFRKVVSENMVWEHAR